MIKKLDLTLREMHLYKDVNLHPLCKMSYEYEETEDKIVIPVVNGIAYARILGNHYERIYAAVKETPEELAKNPNVELLILDKL